MNIIGWIIAGTIIIVIGVYAWWLNKQKGE